MILLRSLALLVLGIFAVAEEGLTEAAKNALVADFPQRDKLPQTATPFSAWYLPKMEGSWGPHPVAFPLVNPPANCNPELWKRARVIAVARHYFGLPYQHHHIPAWAPPPAWTSRLGGPETAGLDCSNFTSWIFNYGLGIRFSSDIAEQADGPHAAGRRLEEHERFEKGDLLFILQRDRTRVSHVVLFVDDEHIIDSHGSGVAERPFKEWYRSHLSHARRVIEE